MNQGRYGNSHFEGRAMSALNKSGQQARSFSEPAWLGRVQHQKAIMEPPTIKSKRPTLSSILSEKGIPGGIFVMGEVLFVSRPLFYVLLIRKYGVRSWFPWFISLAVDLIGMGSLCLVTTSGTSRNNQYFHLSNSGKDELRRRKMLWALYLMRDPFFSKYTRQRLDSTERALEPVPVVGFSYSGVIELLVAAQTRYTYMSGS